MPESRAANILRLRRLRAEKPTECQARNAAYKKSNPEKAWAHKQVEMAIKRGDLHRQCCERCGSNDLVHAHHDDYSQPLKVMWLCPLHHRERHREIGGPGIVSNLEAVNKSRVRADRCIYQDHHRFRVAFDIGGKSIGFGCFSTLEEARHARDAALPEVARLRKEDRATLQRDPVFSWDRPASVTSVAPIHRSNGGEIGAIGEQSLAQVVQGLGHV